jgi:glutathione S-transferase
MRETIQLVGRSSSHFTRVTAIFGHELGVPLERVVVRDIASLDPADYGGHPALKLPVLRVGSSSVLGTENICRRLTELAGRSGDPRIVFPERATSDLVRNAQELTWHAMSAQVQLVLGTIVSSLPADAAFFAKGRQGFEGALAWLEDNHGAAIDALPRSRDLSVLEVTLFCLVEHLAFRVTVPTEPYPQLRAFATSFRARASARETAYRFDLDPVA